MQTLQQSTGWQRWTDWYQLDGAMRPVHAKSMPAPMSAAVIWRPAPNASSVEITYIACVLCTLIVLHHVLLLEFMHSALQQDRLHACTNMGILSPDLHISV